MKEGLTYVLDIEYLSILLYIYIQMLDDKFHIDIPVKLYIFHNFDLEIQSCIDILLAESNNLVEDHNFYDTMGHHISHLANLNNMKISEIFKHFHFILNFFFFSILPGKHFKFPLSSHL